MRSLLGGLWFAAASLAATLTGQLTDPQAQPVSDAIVKAGTHETRTDSVGRFALPSLAPGNYIVTGSAPEFESVSHPVTLTEESLTINLRFKRLATRSDAVTVTADVKNLDV